MGSGFGLRRTQPRTAPPRGLFLFLAAGSLAAAYGSQLRRGGSARPLAIPGSRGATCIARLGHPIFRVHPRHARSVVQARLSAETPQEAAVLAMGRVPRAARCTGHAVHLRAGTTAGPP